MALQKEYASIDFSGGRAKKVSDKLQLTGSFNELLNARRLKYGDVNKRNGYDGLESTVISGAKKEITDVECGAASGMTTGQYFTINSANDETEYYVWYDIAAGGGDPAPAGKTAIEVDIGASDTAVQVATATASAINAVADFEASVTAFSTSTVRITNLFGGVSTDVANVDAAGFTIRKQQDGTEEPGDLGASDALAVLGDELIQYKDSRLYSRTNALGGVIEKGFVPQVSLDIKSISRTNSSHQLPDVSRNANLECYAWHESNRGVRVSVFDPSSDSFIINDFGLNTSGLQARVISLANYFYVFYRDGSNNLVYRRLNLNLDARQFESEVQIQAGTSSVATPYDVREIDNDTGVIVAGINGSPDDLKIFLINEEATVGTSVTVSAAAPVVVRCKVDAENQNLWIAYSNTSNDMIVEVRSVNDLTSVLSATTIKSSRQARMFAIEPLTATTARLFIDVQNVGIDRALVDTSGDFVYEEAWIRNLNIGSDAFTQNGVVYLPTLLDEDLTDQTGAFVIDDDKNVVARFFYEVGSDISSNTSYEPGTPIRVSDTKWAFPALRTYRIQASDRRFVDVRATHRIQVDFDNLNQYFAEELNRNLHTVGGVVTSYDCNSAFEMGFNHAPKIISTVLSAGSGSIATGTYSYISIYEWVDEVGNLHRSALSQPVSVTVSSGSSRVTAKIQTLQITQRKSPNRDDVVVSLYRTQNGGSIYYRTDDPTSPVKNDTSSATVNVIDSRSDSSLISQEPLYTTGGVLENFPPPSSNIIAVSPDRVFLKDAEQPDTVVYSKTRTDGEGIAFSPFLFRKVKSPITGLAFLDEKLIVGSRRELFYIAGEGPDNLGFNDSFTEPIEITTDVGIKEFTSVVKTPEGIMFNSDKGIYMLDRALNARYVGADVEDFNGESILSATLVSDRNEVRFCTSSGKCLAYNYFFQDERGVGQWQVWDNHKANDAIVWQNRFVYARNDSGRIFQENPTSFLDDGKPISMAVETNWIKVQGVQNIGRVYKAVLLGAFKSGHKMQVKIYYDYNETPVDILNWDAESEYTQPVYGEDSPYGAGSLYGGENVNVYQFRYHLPRQRVQAIKFRFEDQQSATTGESVVITNLTLEVGRKRGIAKLKESRTI